MTEPTKNRTEVKESISQEAEEVDETDNNPPKDLDTIVKEIINKKSSVMQAFKEQATNDIKNIQESYLEKEEKMLELLKFDKNRKKVANEYEEILQENIHRLKDIAQEDFKTSHANSQKLIEETKGKIHDFISRAFENESGKDNFTKTTGAIFEGINKKVWHDLNAKSSNVMRTASSLSPDYGNVFIHNVKKPPEELEAERLLQDLFEQELLEFNSQIRKDFYAINCQVGKKVEETKIKVNETIQVAKEGTQLPSMPSIPPTDTSSIPHLPPANQVEQSVNELLDRAGMDFQNINECMLNDVTRNKQKINDNVKKFTDKFLGSMPKRFPFHSKEDE